MNVSFKAAARTLDMLGKQQIAGIPTAISELFKNAHDANAENVEADYFERDGLLVIRDDGFGMELEEFKNRWLTIATDTSIRRKSKENQSYDSRHSNRPVLGEKGIGRLAIATIAPQVLILTRARRNGNLSDVTAAFLNWGFFECIELDLHDIRIPLQTFPGGSLPDDQDVANMVFNFRDTNIDLCNRIDRQKWEEIEASLQNFNVNPRELCRFLGDPSLVDQGHGTHFYLLPTDESLEHDIVDNPLYGEPPPIQKTLLAFTTPALDSKPSPVIQTAFRVHNTNGSKNDLIGPNEFFTNDEYQNADHRIWGQFDDWGQFRGSVSVYGEEIHNHVINWRGGKGKKTKCGPFQIKFAGIEGLARHSTLPPTEHTRMIAKTRKIGGLYIYRDGVRIQPYGNTDYDWLDIELRRTKSASYYYFSYRQMFGIVEIDSNRNKDIREKAGREGFRENLAYREMRDILKNFLVQIAADFFREEGFRTELFTDRKQELEQAERHRRARAKKVTVKREQFKRELDGFFQKIESQEPSELALQKMIEVEEQIRLVVNDENQNRATEQILALERSAKDSLMELEKNYRISKPRIGISKRLSKEWHDYQKAFDSIQWEIRHVQDEIGNVITEELDKIGGDVFPRERMESTLNDIGGKARREMKAERKKIEERASSISDTTRELTRECAQNIERTIREVMTQFSQQDFSDLDAQQLTVGYASMEKQILDAEKNALRKLDSVWAQLETINLQDDISVVDELIAVEEGNIALKEQAAIDLHLAQLGMAIEIISHEFGAAIQAVRSGVQGLKSWADLNADLAPLYQNIRNGFEHLDGYLRLFTPLQKRLYRKAVTIHGWEIFEFIVRLFGSRLSRHDIKLLQTDSFAKVKILGYPSSFFPVFINLVDNAIYWLSGQNEQLKRQIQLDAFENTLCVSDTGPGVHDRDRHDIFSLGFTRKPEGRGMGLYIAKKTLNEIGYDLILEEQTPDWNTSILLMPIKNETTRGKSSHC